MKKTLLAIAITGLFGATAQATTVYDADGTVLEVGADIEVNYSKSGIVKSADAAMAVDDADISLTLTQVVSDGFHAIGKVEYSADDSANGNDAALDTALVGLSSDTMGTVYLGKQVTIKDDSGIFNDYKLGVSSLVPNVKDSGNQVVRYKYANDEVYFGAAYAANIGKSEGVDGALAAMDGNIGYTGLENLDLVVYLGSTDITTSEAQTYAQFQGVYTMDNIKLSVIAATTSFDGESGSGFGGQFAYTMDKATYSLGVQTVDTTDLATSTQYIDSASETLSTNDQTDYFVGVGYALTSNATAYAQIGGSDLDDSDLGYAVGIDFGF